MRVAFGTLSREVKMALICGASTNRQVSVILSVAMAPNLFFWHQDHARQRNGEGREIGQGKQSDVGENPSVDDKGILEDMEDDSPWYLGKAKDEYKRKRSQDTARPQDDKDPVQVRKYLYN